MDRPAFTHVIVTYNNRADVAGLLADLRAHAPGRLTIVVDNASPDDTASLVETEFPEVQLIRNSANVGYARAVNQGFARSASPYVFLLNPDIRIGSAEVFEALQRCLDTEPRVAVAGPLQFKDGRRRPHLNFTWSYWTPRAFKIYASHLLGRELRQTAPVRVTFLNAGCLFVRRSAFEAVGGLNEQYFLYGEEPDLFLKLARHGYECRLVHRVSVMHAREQSLRSMPQLRRLSLRLAGGINIADAVVRGVAAILGDKLKGRKAS